jgi:hypothetical protein
MVLDYLQQLEQVGLSLLPDIIVAIGSSLWGLSTAVAVLQIGFNF